MLRLLVPEQFSETTRLNVNSVTVAAKSLRADLTWEYETTGAGLNDIFQRITALIESQAGTHPPEEEPEYLFESGSKRIDEVQLFELPDLRQALVDFDKRLEWTPRSVNRWIESAHGALASHKHKEAFTALLHALDRAAAPHLKIRAKDDSRLKRRAAQETFDGGKQVQAIEMLERIVRNKLALVEAALKSQ